MIEISKEQFLKLEKSKFFAEFNNKYGKQAFNKTGKRYWVVQESEVRQALAGKPIRWQSKDKVDRGRVK